MKRVFLLWLTMPGFAMSLLAQRPDLQQNVTVQYAEMSLNQIISDLQKKYRLNFSYANNLIPLNQKITYAAKNQPLRTVLDALLSNASVSYQIVGDQIVLISQIKPKAEVRLKESTLTKPVYQVAPIIRPDLEPTASTGKIAARHIQMDSVPVNVTKPKRYEAYALELEEAVRKVSRKVESTAEEIDQNVTLEDVKASNRKLLSRLRSAETAAEVDSIRSEPADSSKNKDSKKAKAAEEKADSSQIRSTEMGISTIDTTDTDYKKRPFQIGFVPPLSTNGTQAGQIVNHVSFNILAGYAAGLDGVEFGSLVNIEKDYVKGVQFAGFANIVGKEVSAGQFAGFANINGGATKGAQFAGFINVVGDNAAAGQFAGFANITNGSVKGGQFAGFLNLAKGDLKGPQAAGFTNIAKGTVDGVQVAGFINVAKNVDGVQIGVINVADSVKGVQIGLLNFARHGYRRFEVWGSESFYVNAAYKMGTRQFHNIFALSGKTLNGENYRWAFGYGFGSEVGLSRSFVLNIDAIAWHINENQVWTDELNLLNQLRANLGVQLGKRFALFAGPTFNVYVSNLYDSERRQYGLEIAPWNTYDRQSGRTRVTMWPGINAGIRF